MLVRNAPSRFGERVNPLSLRRGPLATSRATKPFTTGSAAAARTPPGGRSLATVAFRSCPVCRSGIPGRRLGEEGTADSSANFDALGQPADYPHAGPATPAHCPSASRPAAPSPTGGCNWRPLDTSPSPMLSMSPQVVTSAITPRNRRPAATFICRPPVRAAAQWRQAPAGCPPSGGVLRGRRATFFASRLAAIPTPSR